MKQIVFLTISALLLSKLSEAQNLGISDFLRQVGKEIKFDNTNESKFDDSLSCAAFDFRKFKPVLKEKESKSACSLFYKNEQLKKLSFESAKLKYDAYFSYFKEGIGYSIFLYRGNKETRNKGSFLSGFFFYHFNYKKNWFWSLDQDAFVEIDFQEDHLGEKEWLEIDTLSSKNVTTILRLDWELFAEQRINCYKSEILSFSDFIYTEKSVYESVLIPAEQTCGFKLNLDSLTVNQLYLLTGREACGDGIGFDGLPNVNDPEIPIWAASHMQFDYNSIIPSEEKEPRVPRGDLHRMILEYSKQDDK